MYRLLIALVAVLAAPVIASAQDNMMISGSLTCSAAAEEHAIPVEGRPDHSYAVNKTNCTWTTPWTINGVASKKGTGVGVEERHANWSHSSGTYVDTMANGDMVYYSYEFNTKVKDGMGHIAGHKWEILGGTGTFKGVKGKGTCDATLKEDGSADYVCKGEYTPAS